MNYNKLNLTLTAILLISLFFSIPQYNHWIWGNIFSADASIVYQAKHLQTDERMKIRFGLSYITYMNMVDFFKKNHIKDPVLLLPPNDYLRAEQVKDFESVEPSEFYYFTGYKAVWANSPDVLKADWVIGVTNHQPILGKIKNKQQLDTLLTIYKPYPLRL